MGLIGSNWIEEFEMAPIDPNYVFRIDDLLIEEAILFSILIWIKQGIKVTKIKLRPDLYNKLADSLGCKFNGVIHGPHRVIIEKRETS